MNEIEEYLLMIFLERLAIQYEPMFEYCKVGKSILWESFKKEELGRTIQEEFEFYVSDNAKDYINKEANSFAISMFKSKTNYCKNKIKITVVEEK